MIDLPHWRDGSTVPFIVVLSVAAVSVAAGPVVVAEEFDVWRGRVGIDC